jgi:TPR repeat protein
MNIPPKVHGLSALSWAFFTSLVAMPFTVSLAAQAPAQSPPSAQTQTTRQVMFPAQLPPPGIDPDLLAKANAGDAGSQFMVGDAYAKGQGVARDLGAAATWYRKAADHGLSIAQDHLAAAYGAGDGVEQSYANAVSWYRKAAQQGYAPAELSLGDYCLKGLGVPQDNALAAEWYRKAADQGLAEAQFNVGSLYLYGRGLQQDYAEAYFWLNLAAAGMNGKALVKAIEYRDEAATELSQDELSAMQQKATKWVADHPIRP